MSKSKSKSKSKKTKVIKVIIKQNVGVDVSKDDIKVALSHLTASCQPVLQSTKTFPNNVKGFKQLEGWLKKLKHPSIAVTFTMEATGVYHEALAYYLFKCGYSLYVLLPNLAKKYRESLGLKSSTDKIDARALAQMGLERELRPWVPISPSLLGLKQLTRERSALVCIRTSVSNQLHAYSHQGKPNRDSIARTKKHISFLDKQVKAIESEVSSFIKTDEALKTKIDCLISIPGVGIVTAATIVAETNGFAGFGSIKQLTSYAGLDVRIMESGKWKGKSKISKRGNSHIRKALYMPTLSKIVHDDTTSKHYERLKEKKGIGMVAVVAEERKLLGLMFSLWKKGEMYKQAP
jgi:transposase